MIAEKRTMPAPTIDPETQEYWSAIEAGKFLLRYCNACEAPHYYPRTICPHCGSDDTEFKEASGKGIIYSYSVMRRVPVPYAIAYVTLEGTDISMMTNIVECDLDDLHVGQEVKMVFSETEGDGPPLPTFTPV
ncbi:MAG: OB-fold domain-containing protein [Sneathiella sp.]|nr:OB-fold domain-containing protein [Sneathiella sp.]